jgi:DNA-binding transcriptional ArsR family regulator
MSATARATDARAAEVFGALADGTRRDLMARLAARPGATATELAEQLPITRQAVLKQLTTLASAGLVASSRDGRAVRYRLTPAPLSEAVAWMTSVGSQWDERLASLAAQLSGGRAAR